MKYNPFKPDRIADPNLFAGRVSEIEIIKRSLFQAKHGNPPNLLITGERGIGKSSLLHYVYLLARGKIPANGENYNFLTLSVDLYGVQRDIDIIEMILRELRSTLNSYDVLKSRAKKTWEFCLVGRQWAYPTMLQYQHRAQIRLLMILLPCFMTLQKQGVAMELQFLWMR